MSEQNVPIVRTPIDMRTYARAVARAWNASAGAYPTKAQAGVLWAHYGIETSAGPSCWNWNIGNVKHVSGDGHDFIMLPNTWEMEAGKRVVYQPPNPQTWFRSFSSLDDAMSEHFALLHGKRYAAAWEGVELGDCGVFARLLRKAGYFTADATAYAAGMRPHFARWMASTAVDDALAELRQEDVDAMPPFAIVHRLPGSEDDDAPPSAA